MSEPENAGLMLMGAAFVLRLALVYRHRFSPFTGDSPGTELWISF